MNHSIRASQMLSLVSSICQTQQQKIRRPGACLNVYAYSTNTRYPDELSKMERPYSSMQYRNLGRISAVNHCVYHESANVRPTPLFNYSVAIKIRDFERLDIINMLAMGVIESTKIE